MMNSQRILVYIIPVVASMIWLLAGCSGGEMPRYDARLVLADSLLRRNDPDSALQLLAAIDGHHLPNAGDRAYHALLLTQAQYRCYVDITSDSTINVALDYYKQHSSEQEKLTRAYIYKGAVTEVLGDPEAAMAQYKQACGVAAPEDHFNLGYAFMRIGSLYRDYLAADSLYISLFKKALSHFEQVHDSFYIANCLSYIGNCYSADGESDSAIVYLERADSLTKALHLTDIEIANQVYLAYLKMFSKDIYEVAESKALALSVLNNESCPADRRDELRLISCYTLARLHKPDSASIFLNQVDGSRLHDGLLVLYHHCLAEIAGCHGNIERFRYHFKQADNLADSLITNEQQRRLRDVEAKYDNEALRYKALRAKTKWQLLLMGSLLAMSLLTIALLVIAHQSSRRKRQILASQKTIARLESDSARLTSQLAADHAMSETLKTTIRHQIDTFTKLVEMYYTQFSHHPKKFGALFQKAYDVNQPDASFWSGLRAYADSTCDGIITRTLEMYPSVNENDVRFLSLCCCGLPTTVIMACMGYNDVHSVYNKKHRIEVKLGDDQKFDDYVQLFRGL